MQKTNKRKSVGHHSIKYLKLAHTFEQNFAFTTLSFWKQWINTLLPHSSFVKMQLSTYEAFKHLDLNFNIAYNSSSKQKIFEACVARNQQDERAQQ